ncbi:hypothetical protein M271_04055 [Streptomyces rapamycinicus NRRL 5491]|nr:hypothetical protein M271_04055 [Streptomyces rapamycinicus NRRL 5491]
MANPERLRNERTGHEIDHVNSQRPEPQPAVHAPASEDSATHGNDLHRLRSDRQRVPRGG